MTKKTAKYQVLIYSLDSSTSGAILDTTVVDLPSRTNMARRRKGKDTNLYEAIGYVVRQYNVKALDGGCQQDGFDCAKSVGYLGSRRTSNMTK